MSKLELKEFLACPRPLATVLRDGIRCSNSWSRDFFTIQSLGFQTYVVKLYMNFKIISFYASFFLLP